MTNTQWKQQLEAQLNDTRANLLRLEGALQLITEIMKEEKPPVKKVATKKPATKETNND